MMEEVMSEEQKEINSLLRDVGDLKMEIKKLKLRLQEVENSLGIESFSRKLSDLI